MRFEEIVDAIIYNELRIFDIDPISTEEFDWFIKLLKGNTSLQVIKFTHNQLDDTRIFELVEALKNNQLEEALKDKQTLTELDLSYHNLSNTGVKYIANLLKTNSSLQVIKLTHNRLNDACVFELVEALKNNQQIIELDLSYNNISSIGTKYIADLLKINSSLTIINLGHNNIGNFGLDSLLEALKTNRTLKSINLDNDKMISSSIPNFINRLLQENSKISVITLENTLLESQLKQQECLMRSKAEDTLAKNQVPLQNFLTKNSIFIRQPGPLYQPTDRRRYVPPV
ncbi:MAG TPA: hypothetical protein VJN02_11520 [Gammaproteobacteria bacterium]|nr:hypothetical protein [Gammaproteobacteria bacterium]